MDAPTPTILDAMAEPELFGSTFAGDSWRPWRAALAAIFALPLEADDLALFRECTGREAAPTERAREVFLISGRRSGKSLIASLCACYLAAFTKFRGAPGEKATVALIAADRLQARVAFRYVLGLLKASPILSRQIVRERHRGLHVELRRDVGP